jgi:hypothetical protein
VNLPWSIYPMERSLTFHWSDGNREIGAASTRAQKDR